MASTFAVRTQAARNGHRATRDVRRMRKAQALREGTATPTSQGRRRLKPNALQGRSQTSLCSRSIKAHRLRDKGVGGRITSAGTSSPGAMPKKSTPATTPVAQSVSRLPATGCRPPYCRRVPFRALALMRYQKRRCSPPPSPHRQVVVGRGRAGTEVRRARSYLLRQGRDCLQQSCAAVSSAYWTLACWWASSHSSWDAFGSRLSFAWFSVFLLFGFFLVFSCLGSRGLGGRLSLVATRGGRRASPLCVRVLCLRVLRSRPVASVGASVAPGPLSWSRWTSPIFSLFIYLGRFAAFSELRGTRQVERFAACSFRHLPLVVFHPGG